MSSCCNGCAPKLTSILKPFKYTHMSKGKHRDVSRTFYEAAYAVLTTLPSESERERDIALLLIIRNSVIANLETLPF